MYDHTCLRQAFHRSRELHSRVVRRLSGQWRTNGVLRAHRRTTTDLRGDDLQHLWRARMGVSAGRLRTLPDCADGVPDELRRAKMEFTMDFGNNTMRKVKLLH